VLPKIERLVRAVKERCGAACSSTPCGCWPEIGIIRGAGDCVKRLNEHPFCVGRSDNLSPRTAIMERSFGL